MSPQAKSNTKWIIALGTIVISAIGGAFTAGMKTTVGVYKLAELDTKIEMVQSDVIECDDRLSKEVVRAIDTDRELLQGLNDAKTDRAVMQSTLTAVKVTVEQIQEELKHQ